MKIALQNFIRTEKFCLLVLAAVSFILMLPVLLNGIPNGHDLPHHYQCAMTFYEGFLNGDFYPSWSLNRNFGYGGMESRLYPPVSHYSLAIAYYFTTDWHLASWIVFTFFTFLGALGIYLWAKEYLPARQAVFAGCFYALTPYHLSQLYNTFFFAEFVGSAVLPFSFYFVSRVCRRGKTSDIVGLALALAVLILTHLPLTVIGAICLSVYSITLLKRESFLPQIAKLSGAVALGLAASSFFWTKVLLERGLMAKTGVYADPWLDYRLNFLLTPIQTFEGDLATTIYENSLFFYDYQLLLTLVLVAGCTVPFLIRAKGKNFSMKGVWLLLGLAVFLAIPLSRFVWDAVKPLQEVQFPWRWMTIVCLTASMLSASYLNLLVDWFKTKNRAFALIICGCVLSFVTYSLFQVIRPANYLEKEKVQQSMKQTSEDIGFTFWWTVWTRKEALEVKEKVTAENRSAQIHKWTATAKEFEVSEGTAADSRIAVFYYPNWKATVNDRQVEVKADPHGAVLIPLESKISRVRLTFEEPFAVNTAQWISGGGAFLLFLLLFFEAGKKFRSNDLPLSTIRNLKF